MKQPVIDDILIRHDLMLAFREFLYSMYSNENLSFWIEVGAFFISLY